MSHQTLLVWTTRNDIFGNVVGIDHWKAFDSLEDARSEYNQIINRDDIFSASICGVIESTDYETTMEVQS